MRCLDRDKQWVLVAFFAEKVARTDEQGRLTGKHDVVRTDPMPVFLSVSASRGAAENSPFGIDLDYDRTLIIEDTEFPVDESSVFWIDNIDQSIFYEKQEDFDDVDPGFTLNTFTDKPHDYTVKRVAKSPNCIAVAVKRVEVSR